MATSTTIPSDKQKASILVVDDEYDVAITLKENRWCWRVKKAREISDDCSKNQERTNSIKWIEKGVLEHLNTLAISD